jgi:hypothetical protein
MEHLAAIGKLTGLSYANRRCAYEDANQVSPTNTIEPLVTPHGIDQA